LRASPCNIITGFGRSQNLYLFNINPFRMFNHDHRIHSARDRRSSHDLNRFPFLDIQRREISGLYLAYGLQEGRYFLDILSSDAISISHGPIEWRSVGIQHNGLSNDPFETLLYGDWFGGQRFRVNSQAVL